jgi:hypothetical protein
MADGIRVNGKESPFSDDCAMIIGVDPFQKDIDPGK